MRRLRRKALASHVNQGSPTGHSAEALGRANEQLRRQIAERGPAEQALRDSEAQFRAMADTSPLAISLTKGPDHRAIYLNPTFTRLFGYTIDDVPTMAHWYPLAYPDEEWRTRNVREWERRVVRALETGTQIEPMESVVTSKDGSQRSVLWGYTTIGELGWSHGLDLTDLRRSEAALRESEAKYEVMFAHSPDPFLVLANGVLVDCNEAAARMLRCHRANIVGQTPAALSPPVQPDGRNSQDAPYSSPEQAERGGHESFEWVHRRFDGTEVMVEVSMAALT